MCVILIISLILLTLTALPAGKWFGRRGNSPCKVRYQILYADNKTAVSSTVAWAFQRKDVKKHFIKSPPQKIYLTAVAEYGKSVNVQTNYHFHNKNPIETGVMPMQI